MNRESPIPSNNKFLSYTFTKESCDPVSEPDKVAAIAIYSNYPSIKRNTLIKDDTQNAAIDLKKRLKCLSRFLKHEQNHENKRIQSRGFVKDKKRSIS